MQPILAVTVPFFALVLMGWLAAHRRVLPEEAIPGLNAFVLYFALPCMLFRFGATTPIAQLLDPVVIGTWLVAAGLIVWVVITLSLNERVGLKDAAFGALVAAFPNSGFMGVPLLVALLGPAAAGPLTAVLLADILVTTGVCLAIALKGPLSNPQPWAIALGIAVGVLGLKLPGPVDTVIAMLANAASPVALFTIGAVLCRAGRAAHGQTPARDYVPVAAAKLLLHPLLVAALALAAQHIGAPLSTFQITVIVLVAALPSASNVSLLAERFGADNGRIARIILASTAAAFITFTAAAWLLGARPAPA
jgi:malonate transporter and related proteins